MPRPWPDLLWDAYSESEVVKSGLKRRAQRALERQLDYQRAKALDMRGHEHAVLADMARASHAVRGKLEQFGTIRPQARVLEVGSGAHGLVFCFDAAERVGVDPLADEYRSLFPAWQNRATTVAAGGESLPFEDARFDVVLCDNVVDHAESPRRILQEIARVLVPGGLFYFTVNVHHPLYHWAASLHAAWRALGLTFEVTPFADHTVHLTLKAARGLFDGLPLRIVSECDDIEDVKASAEAISIRHAGDRLKRSFFKNARYEVIAVRD